MLYVVGGLLLVVAYLALRPRKSEEFCDLTMDDYSSISDRINEMTDRENKARRQAIAEARKSIKPLPKMYTSADHHAIERPRNTILFDVDMRGYVRR